MGFVNWCNNRRRNILMGQARELQMADLMQVLNEKAPQGHKIVVEVQITKPPRKQVPILVGKPIKTLQKKAREIRVPKKKEKVVLRVETLPKTKRKMRKIKRIVKTDPLAIH